MNVRFLLDENQSPRLKAAVLRLDISIDILRVGDAGAPSFGTLDPDLLQYLSFSQRLLITANRVSIPAHVNDLWSRGGHHWGIFWVVEPIPIRTVATALLLLWAASTAEEWIDRLEYLPV